jgi:hypothetical protein
VVVTLVEAVGLVFLVMLVFLQDLRATLIPTIAVPPDLLEIGEAHRELGRFEEAHDCFTQAAAPPFAEFLSAMAIAGDGRVVRVDNIPAERG